VVKGCCRFDAQMWAAAQLNQIPYLLTEDMATGRAIDGVTIIDAFSAAPPDIVR
jgi:predicted nucleic acid-binding protein